MRQLSRLNELAEPALRRAMKGRPSLEAQRRLELLLKQIEAGDSTRRRTAAFPCGRWRRWNTWRPPRRDSSSRRWPKVPGRQTDPRGPDRFGATARANHRPVRQAPSPRLSPAEVRAKAAAVPWKLNRSTPRGQLCSQLPPSKTN